MRAPDRTLFTVLSQFFAAGLVACQVAEEPGDDYRNLPSYSSDSCVADCEDGDSGYPQDPDYPDEPKDPDYPDGEEACDYRTQTQGGWGTACKGGNPGCFRDDYFKTSFPYGLKVGGGSLTATMKNSKSVEGALPAGGKPRKLYPAEAGQYDGYGDPDPKTVLFGQAVALTLNVEFDAVPAFNPYERPAPLADLTIAAASSPCYGMTVAEVLAEANAVLGGYASPLSASHVNACATLINQSFVDGGGGCSADLVYDANPG